MFGLELWQCLLIVIIAILIVIPYRIVWSKAGFPANYGFIMLIPLVNVGMLWYLAVADWPSLKSPQQTE